MANSTSLSRGYLKTTLFLEGTIEKNTLRGKIKSYWDKGSSKEVFDQGIFFLEKQ